MVRRKQGEVPTAGDREKKTSASVGWGGYRVEDRIPTKSIRKDGERNVHLPSILYLIEEVEGLLIELQAEATAEGRIHEVNVMHWMQVKIVGHLRRTYDRQRKRMMRIAATPHGKAILEAELKLAQEGATKVRQALLELQALEEQYLSRKEAVDAKRKAGHNPGPRERTGRGPHDPPIFIDPNTGKTT